MTDTRIFPDLITPAELADEFGVTIRTLQDWDARRIGPPRIKIAKCVFYRRSRVLAWLEANERESVRGPKTGPRQSGHAPEAPA